MSESKLPQHIEDGLKNGTFKRVKRKGRYCIVPTKAGREQFKAEVSARKFNKENHLEAIQAHMS